LKLLVVISPQKFVKKIILIHSDIEEFSMTINWFTIRSAVIASIGGYAFGIDGGKCVIPLSHVLLECLISEIGS
jgi:hypothetical protein